MEKILDTMKKTRRVEDLSTEELRTFKKHLLDEIVDLLKNLMNEPGYYGVSWCGTLTDLAELVHEAWLTGSFFDSHGRPLYFRTMLDHICKVLNCRHVTNPYRLVQRAGERKNVYAMPVMDRYVKLIVEYHLKNPMTLDMKRSLKK